MIFLQTLQTSGNPAQRNPAVSILALMCVGKELAGSEKVDSEVPQESLQGAQGCCRQLPHGL